MKVQVKVSPNVIIEAEGDKENTIFEQLASMQEVFGEEKCGKCQGTNLKFMVRTDKDENKYYELRCQKCGAKLPFGCHKKPVGGLFPKRYDDQNHVVGAFGWRKWNKEKGVEE